MKKFFLNKKLMALVLCLCLSAVIIGVGAFAAANSGLPGMSIISEKFVTEHESELSSSSSENGSETRPEIDGDITIKPSISEEEEPDAPLSSEPVVYAAPERMMAVTLTAGKDYFTDDKMSTADIQSSIDSAIIKAKDLSANTGFLETSYNETTLFASADGKQAAVSIDMLKYAIEKAREHGMYVYAVFDVLKYADEESGIPGANELSSIRTDVTALCSYDIDGIMLDTYTVKSTGNAYSEYNLSGGGMG